MIKIYKSQLGGDNWRIVELADGTHIGFAHAIEEDGDDLLGVDWSIFGPVKGDHRGKLIKVIGEED